MLERDTDHSLILLLEDRPLLGGDLALRLRALGYRVAGPARTGEHALDLAAREVPDLLLADPGVGGELDGIEVAERLRSLHGVPTVYLSTYSDEATLRRSVATAPSGYLSLPVREPELRATLDTVLLRQRLERQLRRRDQQLADAQRLGAIGSWDWDGGSGRWDFSDELLRIFGVERALAEREGPPALFALVCPEDQPSLRAIVERARREQLEVWQDLRIRRTDGALRHVRVRFQAQHGDDGKLRRQFGVVQDVTGRIEAARSLQASEQALRESQKLDAIGRLAGGVAHDFNNMLTVMIGLTSALETQLSDGSEAQELVKEVQAAGRRAGDLTRQLLAFARRQQAAPRSLDLNRQIAAFRGFLQRTLGEEVRLVVEAGAELWPVRLDPTHLEQVLLNLAINARDALPEGGGTITIATANRPPEEPPGAGRGPGVVLSVRDDGVGIPAALLPRIFEPFFTTKELGRGTGLGLATVYGIVRQGEGDITVESEPGRGTHFQVWFPRDEQPADPPDHAANGAARAPQARRQETVVLVEDEAAVRATARLLLEQAGYRVVAAASGTEAWRVLLELPRVDLLLTDVVMHDLSGPALAARLSPERPAVPVLFMSGSTRDPASLGATGRLLPKPFSRDELLRAVRAALDG